MADPINSKRFDLEERTFRFARDVRIFFKTLDPNMSHLEDRKQIYRSSGSVAANYIEANEAISKKDFLLRVKICRKEAKESHFWLRLLKEEPPLGKSAQLEKLLSEALQLARIFGAIANRCKDQ